MDHTGMHIGARMAVPSVSILAYILLLASNFFRLNLFPLNFSRSPEKRTRLSLPAQTNP